MQENPQWLEDNRGRLWELHLKEVIEDPIENPDAKVNLPINDPFVIHETREILKEPK